MPFFYYCSITLVFLMGFLLKRKLTATGSKGKAKTDEKVDNKTECKLKENSNKENLPPKTHHSKGVGEKSCFTPAFSSLKVGLPKEIDEGLNEEYFHNHGSTKEIFNNIEQRCGVDSVHTMSKNSIKLWKNQFIAPNVMDLFPTPKLDTTTHHYAFEGFKEFHTVKTWKNVSNFKPRETRFQRTTESEKKPSLQIFSMFE
ncbi:hypothetical protein ACO0QE_000789 [Hanseniaspora vineae]